MKNAVKIIAVLTTVCLLCAASLSLISLWAKDKIAANEQKRIEEAIKTLAPQAEKIEKEQKNEIIIYKLFDSDTQLFAYAFNAEGLGYQGTIKLMVVTDTAFTKIAGIEVIDSVETPGLGSKIQEPFFKDQFKGIDSTNDLEYTKDTPTKPNQIKAITGATISSKSVIAIINKRIAELKGQKK
jgi:electron transport complex protein RnfG